MIQGTKGAFNVTYFHHLIIAYNAIVLISATHTDTAPPHFTISDHVKPASSLSLILVSHLSIFFSSSLTTKRGNVNRSVWMHTCWKYCEKIEKNPGNGLSSKKSPSLSGLESSTGVAGVLEMSIYATLSCNLKVTHTSLYYILQSY